MNNIEDTTQYLDELHKCMATGWYSDVNNAERRAIGRTIDDIGSISAWCEDMLDALYDMVRYGAAHTAHVTGDNIDVLLTFGLDLPNNDDNSVKRPNWDEGISFTTSYRPYTKHVFYCKPWMTYVRYLRTRHQRGVLGKRDVYGQYMYDDPKDMLHKLAVAWHRSHSKWLLFVEPSGEWHKDATQQCRDVPQPLLMVEDDAYTSWTWVIPECYK